MKTKDSDSAARKPYEPTAKDIRRECERIQASWSQRERNRRAGQLATSSWVPPSVNWAVLADVFSESQGDGPAASSLPESSW